MDATARRLAAGQIPARLLSTLEANAASTVGPPGLPLAAPLTDVAAHRADIRWALGHPLADWSPPSRLLPVLGFLTSGRARAGFVPPGRLRGLALEATDQDWRHGTGQVVSGPSLLLAMAVLGRREAAPGLTGDGVELLEARSGAGPSVRRRCSGGARRTPGNGLQRRGRIPKGGRGTLGPTPEEEP